MLFRVTPALWGAHRRGWPAHTLRLPHPVEVVYDLFERETIAENTSEISVTLQPRSTVLYYTGM